MVATVLMGWELGGGLGHVHKLLRVARALAAEGHRPVFACANVIECAPLLREAGFPVLQAPVWHPSRRERNSVAASLADVLAVHGWAEPDNLLALVSAWERLLEMVKPRLIVADFSPTLCLTAFRRLPIVLVENWFSAPPPGPEFPILLPGQAPVMPQEKLTEVVQEVQKRRAQAIPASVPEILTSAEVFVTVLPEVDPYAEQRPESTWDPLEALPPPMGAPEQPRFFAYLSAELPRVDEILTELALTGFPGTVYLRGASLELKQHLRLQGLEVLDRPARLEEVLKRVAVIVHHGGLGTTHTALAAGRPQLLLTLFLEQMITSDLLRRLGVGLPILGNYSPHTAGRALQTLLGTGDHSVRASAVASALAGRPRRDTLAAICAVCRRHLVFGE